MIPPSFLPPLALALLFDALAGDPDWIYRRVPHPVVLMGRAIAALDRAWNRPEHRDFTRLVRGGVAVVAVIGLSAVAGLIAESLIRFFAYGWIVEAVLGMSFLT